MTTSLADWPCKSLGELLVFRNGVNADKKAYGHGVPFINVLEVIENPFLQARHVPGRISIKREAQKAFEVRRGDVLFNRTSETQEEVALTSVYCDSVPVVFGGFVIRGRPIDNQLWPDYVGYGLRAQAVRTQVITRAQGAIRANLGQQELAKVIVPVPPLPEQRAIAAALSDVDALLDSLDRLIAKKRDLKQGTMQQLLTGQTRLPGFDGKWVPSTIGEVASKVGSGITPTGGVRVYRKEGIPFIRSQNVGWGQLLLDDVAYIDQATHESFVASELVEGDVLLNITGASIGRSSIADQRIRGGNVNQHVCIIRPRSDLLCSEYLKHFLLSAAGQEKIDSFQAGGNRQGLNFGQIRSFDFVCPPLPEQTAIASVLSDMDAEIIALEQRRDKTKLVKQGMMQELLTGKIRLV